MSFRKEVLAERLRAQISEQHNGCWLWIGGLDRKGYGVTYWKGRSQKVHRVVYEELAGQIPHGLQLDHLCRVRNCVNPAHLEPVTLAENVRRGNSGLQNRTKTHCPRGHEYTPDNTYLCAQGKRSCKACRETEERKQRRRELFTDPARRAQRAAYLKAWKAKQKGGVPDAVA